MRTASQSLLFDITFKSITIIIAQTAAFRFLFFRDGRERRVRTK